MVTEISFPRVTLVAVDDDSAMLELVAATLTEEGVEVVTCSDPEEGLEIIFNRRPQIVLADLKMPRLDGMQLLDRVMEKDPGIDVVLMTAHYSTESAVEAIKRGACDYLNKPFSVEVLRNRVGRLIEEARKHRRVMQLEEEILNTAQFEGMVGRSAQMLEVFVMIRRISPHFQTVLITGATGTGKELVARALHQLSPHRAGRFVAANCSAIVETLLESELFGYVKGAFAGASRDKEGLFEYANVGTIFLDEIGDLPLTAQAKFLRVLQNQEVQRVGSPVPRKVDLRVVAATNSNLPALVKEKRFREDLFYRLSALEIQLPPLAERREDLPLLIRHFLERAARQLGKPIRGMTRRAQGLLARYSWPGNVRELQNVISHACMMAEGELIDVSDFPDRLLQSEPSSGWRPTGLVSLEEMQRQYFLHVLEQVGRNRARAAEILGIGRTTLYRWLQRESGVERDSGLH